LRARRTLTCAALGAAILGLLVPRAGVGGDWHQGGRLVCSDCHTSHNSADGQPMRYDRSPGVAEYLLRGADAVSLCFACHDGSNPRAPDVLAPVGYVAEPAAGIFPTRDESGTGRGHRLLRSSPQQVPLGSRQMILSCGSCHDTHGNGNYRNLRPRPGGGTADLLVVVDQAKQADGANPADVYALTNLAYRSGVNAWCVDCHDRAPTDHGEHPISAAISGATLASYAQWLAVAADVRVPVENPTDPVVPSTDDRLACVSCHYGHGSATSELRTPAGTDLCAQCHVQ
jgi:predicted CXXCH cytochrome family protein